MENESLCHTDDVIGSMEENMLRQELPMKFPMAMTTTTTNSNFSKISSIEQRSGEE